MGKKKLGQLFRRAREAKGIAYYGMAEDMGLSPTTINNMENGRIYPSIEVEHELIRRLDVSAWDVHYAVIADDEGM